MPKNAIIAPIIRLFLNLSLKKKIPIGMRIKHTREANRFTFATLVCLSAMLKNNKSKAKNVPATIIYAISLKGILKTFLRVFAISQKIGNASAMR
ncbi:hypothetical protein NHP164001_07340 [Helicobacter trogontum]|uniref:Uncharacterized protein n=1 Tax=Helicobacter trogontum TaxID=50960 RepID=A0ABQ0D3B8_9HELI